MSHEDIAGNLDPLSLSWRAIVRYRRHRPSFVAFATARHPRCGTRMRSSRQPGDAVACMLRQRPRTLLVTADQAEARSLDVDVPRLVFSVAATARAAGRAS